MTATAERTDIRRESALWARERRTTTAGLLLMITMAALEAMSVGTAMPTMVAELHGQALYSWPFTSFLAASVAGTVLSGRLSDTRGPRFSGWACWWPARRRPWVCCSPAGCCRAWAPV